MAALKEYNCKELLIAGGVSANSGIRNEFTKLCNEANINLVIPELRYCTDNATMIASAGYFMYKVNMFDDYSLGINPSLDL